MADRHALDVLERDVVDMSILSDAVDTRDILMIESRGGSPFLVEPTNDFLIRSLIGRQQLESDVAFELGVEQLGETRTHTPGCFNRFFEQECVDQLAGNGAGVWLQDEESSLPFRKSELFDARWTVTRGSILAISTPSTIASSASRRETAWGFSPVGLRGSELNIESCSIARGSSPGNTSMPDQSRYRAK